MTGEGEHEPAQAWYRTYLGELQQAMDTIAPAQVQAVVHELRDARARGATIVFCGNGGSASTATHFACDLAKNTIHPLFGRFRTIALNDNVALFSAWGNDNGYDRVFVEQAETWMKPGDVLVAISGSGNSPNVLRAAEYARGLGCRVLGLIGFEGGTLRALCDMAVVVPGRIIEQAEDGHLILNHVICTTIRRVDATVATAATSTASAAATSSRAGGSRANHEGRLG